MVERQEQIMTAPPGKVFSITNGERGTVLAARAKLASSLVDRFFGLMGRRTIEAGGGLLLTKSASIHSFFMRFRFDAIFVDKDNRVVKVVPAMRPWWVAFGGRGAKDTIELPAGAADRSGTRRGDQLVYGEPV